MFDDKVSLYEVGPRDGLQFEQACLPAEVIATFIDHLSQTGLTAIECGSFVSAKAIPQLKDSDTVFKRIKREPGIRYTALVPNQIGLDRALSAEVSDIALFTAASDTFSQKNINTDIEGSFRRFEPIFAAAGTNNLSLRGYVSCAMGCPYEGQIALEKVFVQAKRLYDGGCSEIALADTTGMGHPDAVPDLIAAVTESGIPVEAISVHFHDTPERLAIKKILKALDSGVRIVDTAVGNLGGCPYATGAAGTVATEWVIECLEAEGFSLGVDKARLQYATDYIFSHLGRAPGS